MKTEILSALALVVFFVAEVAFAEDLQVGRFQIIHAEWQCLFVGNNRGGEFDKATDLILLDTATGQTWRLTHYVEEKGKFDRYWEPFIWSRDEQGKYRYYPTPLEQIKILEQPRPVQK